MKSIHEQIAQHKIVPVIALEKAQHAVPLAQALVAGGLPVAEITFRTQAAEESIQKTAQAFPDMLLGAGSITSVEQAKRAQNAGARFIVSAGFSRSVTEYCLSQNLPIYPGVCTPSELMWLVELGLTVAKFFPAEQFGGLSTIKALSAPFPAMQFMPTGGISDKNICEYLAFPKIVACGGSWMVKSDLIAGENFEEITRLTAQAVQLVSDS